MTNHGVTSSYCATVDGSYGWQAICDCEEFMCQAPTYTIMAQLVEEHFAEVLIHD